VDAARHYLHTAGALTAEVAAPGAGPARVRDAVAGKVRDAIAFADGKPLTGHSVPAHLNTWDQVLSS
jgi:hypothetical protein